MILDSQNLRRIKFGAALVKRELEQVYHNEVIGGIPKTLNLLVNDVCNSRCQMCLIWQNKSDKEFNASELKSILSEKLFRKLEYVGVSGGEPTLRKDLPKIFEILCEKKPKLKGLGIISNGIIHDVVKNQILECSRVCSNYDIPFNIMFSIDGLWDIHDKIRGRPGNFESSIKLLTFFSKETEIPTSFGCTITKDNVFHVDRLLEYAQENGLYGRFRIAEFIERLYNGEQTQYIRAFDKLESYHLGLFFHRLENSFETNHACQKTYRNIRQMIAEGKPRQIGCPYQSNAVVMTSNGDLLYCSPKSPSLGNAITKSASSIFYKNLKIRQSIIENDCQNCVHDYHVNPSLMEYFERYMLSLKRKRTYDVNKLLNESKKIEVKKRKSISQNSLEEKILIVGWYGTETAGDKAILWSIINQIRCQKDKPIKIILSSFYPFVTEWTLSELNLKDILVVETYSESFEEAVNDANCIIIGGGPLMDLEVLDHILYAFIQGRKNGSTTWVEGCGLGPLHNSTYIEVVKEILRLADRVKLRDKASTERCINELGVDSSKVYYGYDPAIDFVKYVQETQAISDKNNLQLLDRSYLACFLREWTPEYAFGLDDNNYLSVKNEFEHNISSMIAYIASNLNVHVDFLPMHSFHVGGDDRVFNRKMANLVGHNLTSVDNNDFNIEVSTCDLPLSPSQIIANMIGARLSLCMRFHSVLFAETLGIPYIAIDYTRGGKIYAFLNERNKLDRLLTVEEICKGSWESHLKYLFSLENFQKT